VVDAIIAVEIEDVDRQQRFRCVFEPVPEPPEIPLRKKLVAIEVDAPVAGAQRPRLVLEAQVPIQGALLAPLAPVNLNPGVQVMDGLIRPVRRVTLEHDDLVRQRQVVLEHGDDVEVEIQAISDEGVEG